MGIWISEFRVGISCHKVRILIILRFNLIILSKHFINLLFSVMCRLKHILNFCLNGFNSGIISFLVSYWPICMFTVGIYTKQICLSSYGSNIINWIQMSGLLLFLLNKFRIVYIYIKYAPVNLASRHQFLLPAETKSSGLGSGYFLAMTIHKSSWLNIYNLTNVCTPIDLQKHFI